MRGWLALPFIVVLATPSAAQTGATAPEPREPSAATTGQTTVDASKMGVSLDRIVQGLRFSEVKERRTDSPLKLEYQVQVFGEAPRIDLLKDYDIGTSSPLPYGAPTHNDFINHLTPQAYRSPAACFSCLAVWAFSQALQRGTKSKCEQEIAEYRALVMQGVAVAAPRCTQ